MSNSFKNTTKELLQIIKKHQAIFWAVIIVFVISIIIGTIIPLEEKTKIIKEFAEKVGMLTSENSWQLFINIYLNNTLASFILFITGATIIIPILVIFTNGVTIGAIADIYFENLGAKFGTIFAFFISILPHGIFELAAFFLAAFLGLILGIKIYAPKKIWQENNRREVFSFTVRSFVLVVLPLLFIAAFVESFITQQLANQFLNSPWQ